MKMLGSTVRRSQWDGLVRVEDRLYFAPHNSRKVGVYTLSACDAPVAESCVGLG